MKHRVVGRKLGRTSEHREALLRNLSRELLDKERIKTTLAKAKELRPFAEKLVTLAKRETLHARRQVLRRVHDRQIVAKLFDTISARFAQRPGGYTRIIKLGPRPGDHAEMAIIELVEAEGAADKPAPSGKKDKAKSSRRKTKRTVRAKDKQDKDAAAPEGKTRARKAKDAAAADDTPKKKKKKTSKAAAASDKEAGDAKPTRRKKTRG
jgi:large subunit ribosomal protein L17